MSNIALITAAGKATRMHQNIPKQFLTINDRPVIIYTLEAFQKHPEIDTIAIACLKGWEQILQAYANQFNITKLKHIVQGGDTGQESIKNVLDELEKNYKPEDIVLIHDGNRPLVSADIISDCIVTVKNYGCAISAIPCVEAVMTTDDGIISNGCYPRETLRRTHTPHGFFLQKICDIHKRALETGIKNSVAAPALMNALGENVYFSSGSEKNIKITTVEDIEIFKALLEAQKPKWLK